jgi:hypothetical protein
LFWRKTLAAKFALVALILTLIATAAVGSIGFMLGKRGIYNHTDRAVFDYPAPEPGVAFLQKPFLSEDVSIRLRELLDASF